MANEFKHGSVGTELTQAEWEAVGTHVIDSQATGDIVYASSSSQLSRLGKGADNTVLHLASGIPAWSATLAGLTLTTPTISSTGFANANHAHAASNSGGTLTTVGALDAGSITSNFGTINNGSSTITTTGAITGGSLVADNITLDGNTISTDGDLLIALAGSSPTPDTDRLHIWEGSAGTVASNGVTQLTIEHSDDAGIQFLTPNDKVNYIIFGDADANNTGLLSYNHDGNIITMKAVSNLMALSVSGGVDLQSNSAGLTNVGASGNDWTATSLAHVSAVDSGVKALYLHNTSDTNDADTRALLDIIVNGGSGDNETGDPLITVRVTAGENWALGVDNSESDRFVIANDNGLGSHDCIRITSDKAISFDDANASYTTFSSDYACDGCGKTAISMFECCGTVAWHDDVLALRELQLSPQGLQHMAKLGVYEIDGPDDAQPGAAFINYQKATKYTWAGMYQNRARMDAQYEQLNERLEAIGA